MKVVFSRKGFDSAAGGRPSPIIDGKPYSFPIPARTRESNRTYGELPHPLPEVLEALTHGKFAAESACHLDPDLDPNLRPRREGWRGALGQVGAAQGHLRKQTISTGDLFLFWGLFRPVSFDRKWRYVGLPEHRIFGWLQVDEILTVGSDIHQTLQSKPWLCDHPHLQSHWQASNTVYVAKPTLSLPGVRTNLPGYGLLDKGWRLTATQQKSVGKWVIPSWMNPLLGGVGMTFHPLHRWDNTGMLHAASRGQEFVASIDGRDDAINWIVDVLQDGK